MVSMKIANGKIFFNGSSPVTTVLFWHVNAIRLSLKNILVRHGLEICVNILECTSDYLLQRRRNFSVNEREYYQFPQRGFKVQKQS